MRYGIMNAVAAPMLWLFATAASAQQCRVDNPVLPNNLFPQVKLETSHGDIVVELDRRRAPITANNFLRYVVAGAYQDTIFHRVVADFVVQGGGYKSDLTDVETGSPIYNESGNGLKNEARTIAMARLDDPHSADSQFYFNLADNESLNPNRRNWGYTVFGTVIEGWDVVEAIGQTATAFSTQLGAEDVPVGTIILEDARVIEATF